MPGYHSQDTQHFVTSPYIFPAFFSLVCIFLMGKYYTETGIHHQARSSKVLRQTMMFINVVVRIWAYFQKHTWDSIQWGLFRNIQWRAARCWPALFQLSSLFSLGYWLCKKAICSRRLIQCLDLNANYQLMVMSVKWKHIYISKLIKKNLVSVSCWN